MIRTCQNRVEGSNKDHSNLKPDSRFWKVLEGPPGDSGPCSDPGYGVYLSRTFYFRNIYFQIRTCLEAVDEDVLVLVDRAGRFPTRQAWSFKVRALCGHEGLFCGTGCSVEPVLDRIEPGQRKNRLGPIRTKSGVLTATERKRTRDWNIHSTFI